MKLSIVLPCYNEAENIPLIFSRFREILRDQEGIEVVLVNNGSTDNSQEVFERELERTENSFARVVRVEVNRGYGFGIMSGVRQCRGEVISWTHADMQTDPKDVLLAYEQFVRQPDMKKTFLKGKRVNRNPVDAFFTFGMSVISSLALGSWLDDVNAQPKMFHRAFLDHMNQPPDDFSLDLYVLYLARKLDLNLLEQHVSFAKRRCGEAKGGGSFKGKMGLMKRTWKYIFELRVRVKEELR